MVNYPEPAMDHFLTGANGELASKCTSMYDKAAKLFFSRAVMVTAIRHREIGTICIGVLLFLFLWTGLMTPNEMEILNKIKTEHNKFFIPLGWTTALVTRARKEGRIKDDFAVKTLVDVSPLFWLYDA
jgi:hypothetical protein